MTIISTIYDLDPITFEKFYNHVLLSYSNTEFPAKKVLRNKLRTTMGRYAKIQNNIFIKCIVPHFELKT